MGCTNIQAEIPLPPAIPKLTAVGTPLEGPGGILVDIAVIRQNAGDGLRSERAVYKRIKVERVQTIGSSKSRV